MRSKVVIFLFLFICCQSDFGKLSYVAKLPKKLKEVSGIQYDVKEDAFWMLNDSGNKPSVYLVSKEGKIQKELKVQAKNIDWEDLTQDKKRNLYIGDFGNNYNKRKDLSILKINSKDLSSKHKVIAERIEFSYPEQINFPPKKEKRYFDTEAFFEWEGNFYIFTKSRVKGAYGRTFLYQVPNKAGTYKAKLLSQFETTGDGWNCSITGADISRDRKKVALITHQAVWVFYSFTGNDFFSGEVKEYSFDHISQKESVTFINDSLLFIADEENKNSGRNLYQFSID